MLAWQYSSTDFHDDNTGRLRTLPLASSWAAACEIAIWDEGTFRRAYAGNRDEAVDNVIEADPVGSAIRSLMDSRTEWMGTASDLLGALSEEVGERIAKTKTWPATPRALSGHLRRAANFLRKIGIDIAFNKEGRARTRIIRISCTADSTGATPSAPSPGRAEVARGNGSEAPHMRTVSPTADANGKPADHPTVRENALKTDIADVADGMDANITSHSGRWRGRI